MLEQSENAEKVDTHKHRSTKSKILHNWVLSFILLHNWGNELKLEHYFSNMEINPWAHWKGHYSKNMHKRKQYMGSHEPFENDDFAPSNWKIFSADAAARVRAQMLNSVKMSISDLFKL